MTTSPRPRNRPAAEQGLLLREDDLDAHRARLARLDEPHVAPLSDWVRRTREATGEDVPWPDPCGGGAAAQVVLLRRDPRCSAVRGARVASPHTDDPASGNLLTALQLAGLAYERTLLADVVPWWVEDPARDEVPGRRRRLSGQAVRGAGHLLELLETVGPRAVVLLGGGAGSAWRAAARAEPALTAGPWRLLEAPSPSPLAWHMRSREGVPHREVLVARLREAAGLAGEPRARR